MKKIWIVFNRGVFAGAFKTKKGADSHIKMYGRCIGADYTKKQTYLYE
jgi:hypothetical protein